MLKNASPLITELIGKDPTHHITSLHFQQNGAHSHFVSTAGKFFYTGLWIGRRGPRECAD